ncbi:hypothetical protein [Aliivibrio fischeri]|uniref:Uncharacterized protein n=1 Tax=Aliivibrio fischeri TaxID=668 RepID=A0A510UMZ9_ALIFS|nr:hypothetical protein [Aliivibrio fischeri]GEK16017.1 hypothetical protein AFI02nite_40530 [Aliivibrio fischeri]
MSASNTFRDVFSQSITRFVDMLINNGDISWFATAILVVLFVILYFTEVAKYMLIGIDKESIIQSTLMVFATLLIIASYQLLFDNVHVLFDEIGLSIQEAATGKRDPFYLFNWVTYSLTTIFLLEYARWRRHLCGTLVSCGHCFAIGHVPY